MKELKVGDIIYYPTHNRVKDSKGMIFRQIIDIGMNKDKDIVYTGVTILKLFSIRTFIWTGELGIKASPLLHKILTNESLKHPMPSYENE